MNHWKHWLALIALALVLAACSSPQASPTATSAPETQPPAVVEATATQVEAATPTAASTPTTASTPTEVAAVDYCVECHTDKDQLILTAKPEEEKEKESEGAG